MINYFVIPVLTLLVAYLSRKHIKQGLQDNASWYQHLGKPTWLPHSSILKEAWIFVYLLTAFAVLWFWNVPVFGVQHYIVGALMLVIAGLYVRWTKTFFVSQDLQRSKKIVMVGIVLTLAAIVVMFTASAIAAVIMLPFLIWLVGTYKLLSYQSHQTAPAADLETD